MKTRSLVVLATLSLLPFTMRAADEKSFPGSLCQTTSTSISYYRGNLFNTSSASTKVACPIVRDNPASGSLGSSNLYILDANCSVDTYCTLYSHSMGNGSYYFSNRNTTGCINTSVQTLTVSSQSAYSGGYAYWECTLPPKDASLGSSGVTSYTVNEP